MALPKGFSGGTVVRLRSGGMYMTVVNCETTSSNAVPVVWHDRDGALHCETFDAACLEIVKTAEER